MNLTLTFIAFVVIFVCCFQVYTRSQVINIMRQRVSGLNELIPLRKLLEYIPQHRGMANAFLSGDQSFREKLDVLDNNIDKEIKNVLQVSGLKDKWNILAQVKTVNKDWIFIKQNLSKLDSAESFSLHTNLVKKIFYLINDLGDASNILTTQDKVYAQLAATVFLKLPRMTEMIGQARGMGTGIAAKGVCDTKMRVKLTYLLSNTRQIANAICVEVKNALNTDKELKQQANTVLEDNQKATQYFLDSLDNNIIKVKNIELSSTEYYNAGTEAIQLAFSLMDKITLSMKNNLQTVVNKLSVRIIITKILVGCVSLGMIGMLVSF